MIPVFAINSSLYIDGMDATVVSYHKENHKWSVKFRIEDGELIVSCDYLEELLNDKAISKRR